MRWREWDELPACMQCEEVRKYYNILEKKKISLIIKRVFDVSMAIVLLVILAIPMCVIAIMIKCDSKGSVFYRQERVTAYGKIFRIHKFRTMVSNAEQIGSAVTIDGDSRITKVGEKLRGLRLDELPQLIDVLVGNMTFVGTRPEAVKYVKYYTKEMRATLLLPAGITSDASIRYKDEAELLEKADDADRVYVETILPEKMKWNLESLEEFSLLKDIATISKTVIVVVK